MKTKQKCESEFDGAVCRLPRNHKGKHRDNEDKFVTWTDAGAAQALAEATKKESK